MTQIESPKRKMQKRNDYQRHKLLRKIKRRNRNRAKADQEVAEKQLKKKLNLPRFGYGKTREIYKSDIHFNNDDAANGYGSDYYNTHKDLLNKAKSSNSPKDWQNVINLENHIRNSLKYLPIVSPFVIGAKFDNYNSGKDIHIKPSKRGTFTKAAKRHGMSVQGFASKVLRNPSKYSAAMRKKANFARNAAKWN